MTTHNGRRDVSSPVKNALPLRMDSSRRSVAGSVRTTSSRDDVRHDAMRTSALARDKNVNGVGVGAMLHPVNGYRGELARKGIMPTDHMRKNVESLRAKQREVQQKKEEDESAAAADAFKLKKFTAVESRVKDMMQGSVVCNIVCFQV